MNLKEYSKEALEVKLYHEAEISPLLSKILYLCCGLSGETGELLEKVKKVVRDKNCHLSEEDRLLIQLEIGDLLWYLMAIIDEFGFDPDKILELNLLKIQDRVKREVLGGTGDKR